MISSAYFCDPAQEQEEQDEQEEQHEEEEKGEQQQQQGWRHCVNIVPQPKFMYNTCPTSRRVHNARRRQRRP